ncbi:hypothetical protein niasHT_000923 [Heterodera trifolii]|uniref:Uncharacterized protein n=1 Tax=Heterodera trifolii TaxID=157864 RepID=A0ABD2LS74_9BILA
MKFSHVLAKAKVNLNAHTWYRRVWEKGYSGPPLPKIKRTGKPPVPVTNEAVNEVRTALMREWNVMQWLANPYLNAEKEAPYLERYGNINDEWTQRAVEAKHRKMPSKPKIRQIASGEVEKRRANVGNLLHAHRTVEDELKNLERRNRWD